MHCATDNVPDNGGGAVAMGCSCAIWRKCNTHADNGLSGAVGEFVLIFDGDLGQRAAETCQCWNLTWELWFVPAVVGIFKFHFETMSSIVGYRL